MGGVGELAEDMEGAHDVLAHRLLGPVAVARPLAPAGLALAVASGLLPLLLLPPATALCALLAAAAVTTWSARLFQRRLGGYTGDLLGATQQASELAIYLALLAASRLAS